MDKNYNEQLDFILEALIKEYEQLNRGVSFYSEDEPEPVYQKIKTKVNEKYGLQDWETDVLFSNLLIDKYLKSIEPMSISLEGLVFRNNGGYVQKAIMSNRETQKLDAIQNDFKKNAFWLMVFTAVVALGTLVTAWYFAIEIYRYYTE